MAMTDEVQVDELGVSLAEVPGPIVRALDEAREKLNDVRCAREQLELQLGSVLRPRSEGSVEEMPSQRPGDLQSPVHETINSLERLAVVEYEALVDLKNRLET